MRGKHVAHHRNTGSKQMLAIVLTLATLCYLLPMHGFALDSGASSEYLCGHVHDEACGYTEGSEGTPCSHQHDESCGYVEGSPCTDSHVHDESCGYAEGAACTYSHTHSESCGYCEASDCTYDHTHDDSCGYCEASDCTYEHSHDDACGYDPETGEGCTDSHTHDESCGYAKASPCTDSHTHDGSCGYCEASPCTDSHTHDESCGYIEAAPCTYAHTHSESCGYVEAVECSHSHDESCGYAEPVPGTACTHVHDESCDPEATVPEPTPESTPAPEPISNSTGAAVTGDNLLPEDTIPAAGETPQCTCSEKCTDKSINPHCPVCAEDHAVCEGIPQIEYILPLYELEERELNNTAEDGALIKVSGLLPTVAELEVTVVPEEDVTGFLEEDAQVLFAYDIKIKVPAATVGDTPADAPPEMIEYQPSVPVNVSIAPPEDTPIETPVAVTHVAVDTATGETTPQAVENVVTTDAGEVEFEAEGFSVYVITIGSYTPRVSFSYDNTTLDVEYCTTSNGTYTPLDGAFNNAVSLDSDVTTLFFKVSGGTVAGVYRDGSSTAMTANGDIYTIDNITANTIITIGAAIELDVTYGSIAIGATSGSGRVYTYTAVDTQQSGTHVSSNIYTITGTTGTDANGGGYNVSLTGAGDFNVVLSGVSIYTGTPGGEHVGKGIRAPVSTNGVTGSGNINITLVGTNTLKNVSSDPGDSFAALEKTATDSTLIIDGSGSLNATGGADSAGIGSSNNGNNPGTRNITINGGTIVATTQESQGAGIGSGDNKPAKKIKIYGGDITAIGVNNGAGIGGSGSANFIAEAGEVYIYGGTIRASSNGSGAGIGGGGSGAGDEAVGGAGTVQIYGGNITADNIGGGNTTDGSGGRADIIISGGTISADSISGGHGAGGSHAGGTLSLTGGSAKVSHVCPVLDTTGVDGETPLTYNVYVANGGDAVPNAKVTAIAVTPALENGVTYGLNDVYTDAEGRLYLWLPSGMSVDNVTVMINGVATVCTTLPSQAAAYITPEATGGYIPFGQELTAHLTNGAATAYRWEKHSGGDWTTISGATGIIFTPTVSDIGEIRVVINNTYTSPSVFIRSAQLSVSVPTTMVVTVDAAGVCTVSNGTLTNSADLPVRVTNVSFKWITGGDRDANELFSKYTAVTATLTLNGTVYSFSGASPPAQSPSATISAKNGGTPGTLSLQWAFALGTGNYLKLAPATGKSVRVATVTYTVDYIAPTTP